jgi:alanine racemase
MATHRATRAYVNLSLFQSNLRLIKSIVGPQTKTMAIVKADAYGHGSEECAKAAVDAGANLLGVGVIGEGIELRKQGLELPIVVLGGVFIEEIPDLLHYRLSTTISNSSITQALSKHAQKIGSPAYIHLKIDTGMSRMGVSMDGYMKLLKETTSLPGLQLEGVCTHFATADIEDPEYTLRQLELFETALDRFKKTGHPLPPVHCANSSAILQYPQAWKDMIRPGLALYGALPSSNLTSKLNDLIPTDGSNLAPIMEWKSKIILLKNVSKGTSLGYGRQFIAKRDSLIATIPVGYADGLPRILSNKMEIIIRGEKVPQVGAICMDFCLIDVSEIPEVKEEDEAVIIGKQGNNMISVEEVSILAQTIPYEILCSVGKRVPRVYLK